MKKELKTVKVTFDIWKKLKLISFQTEKSIGQIVKELVNKKRVK